MTVNVTPTSITLTPTTLTMEKGETKKLTANVTPSDATYTINWTSSNTNIATVSSTGEVTAKAKGNATITATISGTSLKATCNVTVTISPTRIILDQTALTMVAESTTQLTATVIPSDAIYSINWTSSNTSVATVSSSGEVTAKAKGNATISATISGTSLKASCSVTVLPQAESYSVNGESFSMINVEGGTFTMGATAEQGSDAYNEEKPAHQVTLSTYRIAQIEVTQGLWKAVMGYKPDNYKGDEYPVNCIDWNEAQEFIFKLNQKTNKKFRLPTEAEWEYAARGGSKSKGYKYAGSNTIGDVAWYSYNSFYIHHPVGTKAPNELGIYDMNGNVWEWCQDWYAAYNSAAQKDPTGPASGSEKVHRGGCYNNSARQSRVSGERGTYPTSAGGDGEGFRLALDIENSPKFRLSETVVTVEVNKSVSVNILNGNGSYTIAGGAENVTYTVTGSALTITGKYAGTTSVQVTNNANGATAVVNVIIVKGYNIEKVWEIASPFESSTTNDIRQGFGMDGKFYINNKNDQKVYVVDQNGLTGTTYSGGANCGISRDEEGNIIVSNSNFPNGWVDAKIKVINPKYHNVKEYTVPEVCGVKGRCDFIGFAKGNLMKTGAIYLTGMNNEGISVFATKNGRVECSIEYYEGLSLSSSTVINYYTDIAGDPALLYVTRYAEPVKITNSPETISLPNKGACNGAFPFVWDNKEFILYPTTPNYLNGFAVCEINATEPIVEIPATVTSNANQFQANWLNAEVVSDTEVLIYQYYPGGNLAVYRLYK